MQGYFLGNKKPAEADLNVKLFSLMDMCASYIQQA